MSDRKVVIATYWHNDAFVIPKGLDLEDKTVVKEWCIKYNTMFVELASGERLQIESQGWWEMEFKYPNETKIEDADDWNIEIEDEEEETFEIEIKPKEKKSPEKKN